MSGSKVVDLKKVLSYFPNFQVKYELGRYQDKVLEIHDPLGLQPMTDKSGDEANLTRRQSRLVELLCLLKQIQQSRNTTPDSLPPSILCLVIRASSPHLRSVYVD